MTQNQNKSNDQQNQQSAHESEADAAERRAGVTDKSSEDATSRTKAGKDEGAGGGAKQKQKH
eukprot:gene13478-28556_t